MDKDKSKKKGGGKDKDKDKDKDKSTSSKHSHGPKHRSIGNALVQEVRKDPGIQIEGVMRITLNTITQKILNCVVGEHVTSEVPWTFVTKETVEDNIDLHDESSDFLPIKDQIKEFPGEKLLVGYNATAEEENQFYVCVTEHAEKSVLNILDKVRAEQELRIKNAINKRVGDWETLGSEIEVDETIIKNTRPLFEIEAETKIGELRSPAMFCNRDVKDVKDGYVEFGPPRRTINTVLRKRLSVGVQACPEQVHCEAQTVPGLPSNACTQYEFIVDIDRQLDDKNVVNGLNEFLQTQTVGDVDERLQYNSIFDLHNNDYGLLVNDIRDTRVPEKVMFKEYESLTDVKNSGKCISCAAWHPMLTGTIALAYAHNTRNNAVIEKNYSGDAVFEKNKVLIWNLSDTLKPKLILDSPREVHSLQFCPFDENILVGGCINGQVVIWDITNKIRDVETEIVRTEAQEKYHKAMEQLMGWMKPVKKAAFVNATAVSSLEYSHAACITGIQWLNPYWRIKKTGRFAGNEEEDEKSMQILTCGEDGAVSFWDLNAKLNAHATVGRSRRKKKHSRPADMIKTVSPFRQINRLFRPQFRVKVVYPDNLVEIPFTAMSFNLPLIEYRLDEGSTPAVRLTDRIRYSPHWETPDDDVLPPSELYIGSSDGILMLVQWEGFDFSVADTVPCEPGATKSWGNAHDGPVATVSRSPFVTDMILTVGGKVLALWKDGIYDTPILSRRSDSWLTACLWSPYRASMFYITRADGSLEVWDFFVRSDKPILIQSISGKILTGITLHKLPMPRTLIGLNDYNGSLRVFMVPVQYLQAPPNNVASAKAFFDREIERQEEMHKWRDEWKIRNEEHLRLQKEAAEERARLEKEEQEERERIQEEIRKAHLDDLKRLQHKQVELAWLERAQEHWDRSEEERMIKVLMQKKRIDKDDLLVKQLPVMTLREQKCEKSRKLKERMKNKEKIFEDTVTTLFPETLEEKELGPSAQELLSSKYEQFTEKYATEYEERKAKALDFMIKNPFRQSKGWTQILNEGRSRRCTLDVALANHVWRQNRYNERMGHTMVNRVPQVKRDSHGSEEDLEVIESSIDVQEAEDADGDTADENVQEEET